MESEEPNFVIDGPLTAEALKKFIVDQFVPAVKELLRPHIERLEFLNCSGVPQDGRRLNLSGPELETYKLQREFEVILKGENLDG